MKIAKFFQIKPINEARGEVIRGQKMVYSKEHFKVEEGVYIRDKFTQKIVDVIKK